MTTAVIIAAVVILLAVGMAFVLVSCCVLSSRISREQESTDKGA